MKRKILIIGLLVLMVLGSTACSFLQSNTEEVKVIPKEDTTKENTTKEDTTVETSPQSTGDTTKPSESKSTTTQNTEMDDKFQSLQNGTQEYIKSIIGDRATEVLAAIKTRDMVKLSQAVHPDKGVRFSPYGYVNTQNDQKFTADQVRNLGSDPKKYTWGSFDGSGEPIQLTFGEYYGKFIYDADFLNAKEVGYNKILGKGNTLVNTSEVYPKAVIVEYHFSGIDPQYEGMDWRSLRLAFEKQGTTWYLVGIIHDQWTI